MAVVFAQAADQQSTSSQSFVDVPGATATTTAADDWAIFFSCVLQPSEPCGIEFKLVADGVDVSVGMRPVKIDVFGPKAERVITLEGKAAPGSGKVIKVQWRVTFGQAVVGDRRLMLVQ